jgi:hypothetical protein
LDIIRLITRKSWLRPATVTMEPRLHADDLGTPEARLVLGTVLLRLLDDVLRSSDRPLDHDLGHTDAYQTYLRVAASINRQEEAYALYSLATKDPRFMRFDMHVRIPSDSWICTLPHRDYSRAQMTYPRLGTELGDMMWAYRGRMERGTVMLCRYPRLKAVLDWWEGWRYARRGWNWKIRRWLSPSQEDE